MPVEGLQAVADGLTFDLPAGGRAVIGRANHCDVWFDDIRVSRVHGEVWSTPEGWVYADRGSSLGTWRGGARIDQIPIDGRTELTLADPDGGALLVLTPRAAGASTGPAVARGPVRSAGAYQNAHEIRDVLRIGRADDNDVTLDDLLSSRHHAEVRAVGGQFEIVDLDSLNGTYVNGGLIGRAVLAEGDLIGIGHSEFRLIDGRLQEYVDAGEVTFEAAGVTVTGRGGITLVDDVSFSLAEKSLLAVVGPSGAGKSTLLGALSGLRPPAAGRVLYGGRDLVADYAELRHRIGFVPQEDVLHRELQVGRALEYAGRLRFPPDVSAADREARVEEVLGELGIAHRVTSPIERLSGGERKRTNVALELLTKPSLLFLDEPVSGLDPGLARVMMALLRELADEGRTVVVVTHEISSLSLCDQILVLAPGGVPAYAGPPDGVEERFGEPDMADVFTELSTTDPATWHIGRRVAEEVSEPPEEPAPVPEPEEPVAAATAPASRQGWFSQLRTLTERYVEVLASDRRNAALLLLQAPILGVLILAALPAGELGPPGASEVRLVSAAGIVLFVLLVGATWLGANNAIREIARELPMIRRERAAGLSLSAYVVSKALVLGALTVVQAVVLVALATLRQNGPGDAVLFGWGLGELMVVVALAGIASMALSLFISAVAGSPERATSVLPVVLILQLVLAAGVVLPEIVDKPVLNQLSLVSSTQWGIAGAAATADLNELQVFDDRLRDLRTVDAADPARAVDALAASPEPPSRWAHTVGALATSLLALLVLTALPLVATTRVLRRYDPGRA